MANQLDAETQERVIETVRNKRGSKSASIEKTMSATATEVKDALTNILYWRKREIVHSDEECAERLDEFFDRVNQTGEIPTVEKLALALGTTRKTVWDWENGRGVSAARCDMIKTAKEILAALDAELVSKGKIPQVTYIFRAKNYFGMRDQAEVIVTPNNPLGAESNAEEAQKRLESSVLVEGELAD